MPAAQFVKFFEKMLGEMNSSIAREKTRKDKDCVHRLSRITRGFEFNSFLILVRKGNQKLSYYEYHKTYGIEEGGPLATAAAGNARGLLRHHHQTREGNHTTTCTLLLALP
jgi:hypothetical protein